LQQTDLCAVFPWAIPAALSGLHYILPKSEILAIILGSASSKGLSPFKKEA
jgi:hypothetical protein